MSALEIENKPTESAVVARERIANPKSPDEMCHAITDMLNADNHHTSRLRLDKRVRKLIRQRVNAQQKLIEQIERNAKLRQELATLRGRRVT